MIGENVTQWQQDVTLTPEQQQSLDYQQQLQAQRSGLAGGLYDRMASEYADPADWSNYAQLRDVDPTITGGGLPQFTGPADPTGMAQLPGQLQRTGPELDPSQRYYQDAEDAIYGQFERRQEPRMAQQMAATETALRNQGLRPGDEAYDYQMQQLQQQQDDARLGAQYQATMGAGQEAGRMLGMDAATRGQLFGENQAIGGFDLARAGQEYGMMSDQYRQDIQGRQMENELAQQQYQNQMQNEIAQFDQQLASAGYTAQQRQQQIAEEMQRRGYTLNEINAILTGQQVSMPQQPGFSTASRSAATDYLGAGQMQGQADLDRFSAEQAGLQGLMSGGIGLLGISGSWQPRMVSLMPTRCSWPI
jgi:hypothetical protein